MIDQIIAHHEEEYGASPTVISSAPGKLDFLGDHGDIGQGYLLSMAIDRRFYIAASLRYDNSLRFYSANLNERKKASIAGLKFKREDRWANYCKGVMDSIINMGFGIRGACFTLLSEVPMEIGLASSSAMTVAMISALKTLHGLDMSDAQIIEAARLSESRFMNLHEGIRSFMVPFYAKEGHFTYIDMRSLKVGYLKLPSPPAAFIITDSRVTETMRDDWKAEFNEACLEAVRILNVRGPGHLFRDTERVDLMSSIEGLSERARRISLHVNKENARVQEFCRSLLKGSLKKAGRILFRSHESLRDFLEISCPELDWLTKRALETDGVYGSRMIGSGYGGCTVTMMDMAKLSHYEDHLEEYGRIFGFKASIFAVDSGEGARIDLEEPNG